LHALRKGQRLIPLADRDIRRDEEYLVDAVLVIDCDLVDGFYLQFLEFPHSEFFDVAETPPVGEM
jgi:hypothetical protein